MFPFDHFGKAASRFSVFSFRFIRFLLAKRIEKESRIVIVLF